MGFILTTIAYCHTEQVHAKQTLPFQTFLVSQMLFSKYSSPIKLACEQALGTLAVGQEKEGEVAAMSLKC